MKGKNSSMLQPHPSVIRWTPLLKSIVGATVLLLTGLSWYFVCGFISLRWPWIAAASGALGLGGLAWAMGRFAPIPAQLTSGQRTLAAGATAAMGAVAVSLAIVGRNAWIAQAGTFAFVGMEVTSAELTLARTALATMGGFLTMAVIAGLGHVVVRRFRSVNSQRIAASLYRQACFGLMGVLAVYVALNGRSLALMARAMG